MVFGSRNRLGIFSSLCASRVRFGRPHVLFVRRHFVLLFFLLWGMGGQRRKRCRKKSLYFYFIFAPLFPEMLRILFSKFYNYLRIIQIRILEWVASSSQFFIFFFVNDPWRFLWLAVPPKYVKLCPLLPPHTHTNYDERGCDKHRSEFLLFVTINHHLPNHVKGNHNALKK